MIKLIELGPPEPESVATAVAAAGAAAGAPPGCRPQRIAVCTALPALISEARHAAVIIGWLADGRHLEAYRQWQAASAPDRPGRCLVVADEVVLRGADWLTGRWRDGGPKLKHMALARRAAGLTRQEFSERWRGRAGMVGALPVPDDARGRAYVQNHPVGPDMPGGYDAVNEVYFDDEASLRTRIEWFAEHLPDSREEDLVDEARFIAVREDVIWDETVPV
ncbi:MAG: hypothetical protein M0Z30_12690 [Actinomycetota bacterium]|nr:hypothetical protein [Actinomycetota bacterium]